MVVSAHHLASKAGIDVLKAGGNAVDAAVAVGYALAVTFPEAGNLGGGGFMTVRFHDGRTAFIDFRETAPGAATTTMFQDAQRQCRSRNVVDAGYLAVGVPGTVAGLELARTRYGTRSRAVLMASAIHLARDGFVLDQGDADMLATAAEDFRKDAAERRHLSQPRQGVETRPAAGPDRSCPIAFADRDERRRRHSTKVRSGRRSSRQARRAAAFSPPATFQPIARARLKPLECDYRGYHIISAPPPSSGGVVLCETLNILEGYPIGELGFHSSKGTHLLVEALRRAYHDRNLNLGDPSFVTVDTDHFIDKGYAASLRQGIDPNRRRRRTALAAPGRKGRAEYHAFLDRRQRR